MTYIKQFDSLRAIAVILVIMSHWLPFHEGIRMFDTGVIGVTVFFVLSGFLISRILFEQKDSAIAGGISKTKLIKYFYVRRALRIFPIYYLFIVSVLIFAKYVNANVSTTFWYYATYTSNFYYYFAQTSDGVMSHLWTLAVEEQFYFIWPWILVFGDSKRSSYLILLFILVGVGSQYALAGVRLASVLPFTCFDALGLGALLAWVSLYAKERMGLFFRLLSGAAIGAALLFCWGITKQEWTILPQRTVIALMATWLITVIWLYQDKNNILLSLLGNKALVFLGKISYGMYLYHYVLPGTLYLKIVDRYLNPLLPAGFYSMYNKPIAIFECSILLIVISWLSRKLIEDRFLAMKKLFRPGIGVPVSSRLAD